MSAATRVRVRKPIVAGPRTLFARAWSGEPGVVTVLVGIAVLWTILTLLNPRFISPNNLGNLVLQTAPVATIAMAATLPLLLGEIDLSLGSVSGFAAAIMGLLSVSYGVPAPLAIASALIAGLVVGVAQGTVFVRFGVPSFVVTLGGLLAWQGALLAVLDHAGGNINITDPGITNLTSTYLSTWLALALTATVFAGLFLARVRQWRRRKAIQLPTRSLRSTLLRTAAFVGALGVGVAVLLWGQGVPLVVVLVLALAAGLDYFLRRTATGRHLYAIGSDGEAARRAGIAVTRIRILAFGLASSVAAFGGVLAASRLFAVNQSAGQGSLLLLAIAGAVVGGVSLFGGVGTVWYALIGSVLIGSVANGMDLLSLPASARFMVTGVILVLAVVVDATLRRRMALLRS
jgi:D-xylose transport system permease protein